MSTNLFTKSISDVLRREVHHQRMQRCNVLRSTICLFPKMISSGRGKIKIHDLYVYKNEKTKTKGSLGNFSAPENSGAQLVTDP